VVRVPPRHLGPLVAEELLRRDRCSERHTTVPSGEIVVT